MRTWDITTARDATRSHVEVVFCCERDPDDAGLRGLCEAAVAGARAANPGLGFAIDWQLRESP